MTDIEFTALASQVALAEAPGGKPVLKAYQDSVGVWTIGLGTNLQELTIDAATAVRWMREKLAECEAECRSRFAWFDGLTVARQQALVELVYNMGLTRLLTFRKFLAAMESGRFAIARAELLDSKWAAQVKETRATRIANTIFNG